jgi:hypothetical protein
MYPDPLSRFERQQKQKWGHVSRGQLEMERRNWLKRRSAKGRRLPFRRRIQSIFVENTPFIPFALQRKSGYILSDSPSDAGEEIDDLEAQPA